MLNQKEPEMVRTAARKRGERLEPASLTARAAWFMAARTLAFVFSFGLPLLLVRRLDQHQFGLYKQVFLLAMTAINVLPLGVEMSAFYFLPRAQDREEKGAVVANILVFYAAMTSIAGVALIVWPPLLTSLFNNVELAGYTKLVALLIPM